MMNLVGDVSSSARILPPLDGEKLFIQRAEGAFVWDDKGRRYIDTALGFGAVLLGHSPADVLKTLQEIMASAIAPSFAHVYEHGAAAALASHMQDLSKVMFVNSGSEAVHLACRAARVFTGRSTIAKMAAGFDGWYDEVSFGTVATAEANFVQGGRPSTGRMTLLRFNDEEDLERLFADDHDIAAVLYEPVLANAGCILPAPGYLEKLHAVAKRHGALLICDEVLTGFRLHPGLVSHLHGLTPDIATVGKAIGSGFPVAAVVGRPDVLAPFESGKATRGGTYSGNPMACGAVVSTLSLLATQDYSSLIERGDRLRRTIEAVFSDNGVTVRTSGYGTVFSIWPTNRQPDTYAHAAQVADSTFSTQLHLALRRQGVLIMPSPYGRLYLSFAHTDAIVEEIEDAFAKAVPACCHNVTG